MFHPADPSVKSVYVFLQPGHGAVCNAGGGADDGGLRFWLLELRWFLLNVDMAADKGGNAFLAVSLASMMETILFTGFCNMPSVLSISRLISRS